MQNTFDFKALTAELTVDEGRMTFPYMDTKGLCSIGIGRNLAGVGLRPDEIDYLFANDVAACCDVMDKNIPWWRSLPMNKQRVMINLCFMGWGSFSQFRHFLSDMQAGDYASAAKELESSLWYQQVRSRGPRVVARLLADE